MKALEYLLSVALALLMIGGAVVWTQAEEANATARITCRPGTAARAVFLKGMSIYPSCPGGKRS